MTHSNVIALVALWLAIATIYGVGAPDYVFWGLWTGAMLVAVWAWTW